MLYSQAVARTLMGVDRVQAAFLARAVQSLGTPFFWHRCFWPTPTTVKNVNRTEELLKIWQISVRTDREIWKVVETL